jgi:hypothetical protein
LIPTPYQFLYIVLFWFLETGSCCVAQANLMIPPQPECWDYKCELPYPALS